MEFCLDNHKEKESAAPSQGKDGKNLFIFTYVKIKIH